MKELVAKRYVKALKSSSNMESLEDVTKVLSILADSFKDEKFIAIVDNPNVSADEKSKVLLDSVKSVQSNQINNLIKLLVENKRINIIPAMAEEMRKDFAKSTKNYQGIIYSDSDIDTKLIADLSKGLSKKLDSTISLIFIKNDFDGIKVDVEDLGIEINFSKARINSQMIEHIVKAI